MALLKRRTGLRSRLVSMRVFEIQQRQIAQQAGTRNSPFQGSAYVGDRPSCIVSALLDMKGIDELLSTHIFDCESSIGTGENSRTPIRIPEELHI
jgi:hypothetical protein